MQVRIFDDAGLLAVEGAKLTAQALTQDPQMAITVATGRSPIALYEQLAKLRRRGQVDTDTVKVFQLDTYLGIPEDDPRSLWRWMEEAFLRPLDIGNDRAGKFDAMTQDVTAECRRYDGAIAASGGLGLAVLGLGPNGHVAFNEPPSGADAPTRAVTLTADSLNSNAGYWDGLDVPKQGLTLGMAPLLAARKVIFVVTGAHKHAILRKTIEGPVTPDVPASLFQDHPDALVLADRAAWDGP
ncbi:glucosamine-6-phosphate deaminase [Thalassorhabdomicrobium marinisediminis]|nr:glucosamine-6-phosphate deaminase [Thalassorhabdomicrobium marinisediminis]